MANPIKDAGAKTGVIMGLFQNARVAWRLLRDHREPLSAKLLIPGLAAAYLLLPVDLLPDLMPGIGQLDDLAILALGLKMFVDMSPQWLVQWHRDTLAGKAPTAANPQRADTTVDGDYRVIE